jgi:hypothetical protein
MILYNPTVSGSLVVTGSLTTTGTITSQTLVVQTITSSIEFNTGSTRNGSLSTNTHEFTGSVLVSGSLGIGVNSPVTALEISPSISNSSIKTGGIEIQSYAVNNGWIADNMYYSGSWKARDTGHSTNVYFGAGTINFTRAASTGSGATIFPTSSMFINTSGNVGIGTSSPLQRLHVNNSGSSTAAIFQGSSNSYIQLGVSSESYIGNVSGALVFETGGSERMKITSGGLVGIGTTTPAVRLQIDGTNAQERFRLNNSDGTSYTAFTEQEIRMWRPNDSGAAYQIATQALSGTWTGGGGGIVFSPLNTLRMTIGPTGNIGAPSGTNIFNASDIRLKQNIIPTTYGLNAISLLNPVKFNWVNGFEPSEDGKDMLGFVAQEVLEVIPEAVESFGGDINLNGELIDNPLRVNEKFIIPVLVKAIQEQQAKITALEEILQRNNIQ